MIIFSQRPASTPAVCSAGTGTRWCRRPDIRECPCSDFWGPPRNRRSPLALSGCSPWRWTRSCSREPDVRCSTTTVRRPGQSAYYNVCQLDMTISLLLLRNDGHSEKLAAHYNIIILLLLFYIWLLCDAAALSAGFSIFYPSPTPSVFSRRRRHT